MAAVVVAPEPAGLRAAYGGGAWEREVLVVAAASLSPCPSSGGRGRLHGVRRGGRLGRGRTRGAGRWTGSAQPRLLRRLAPSVCSAARARRLCGRAALGPHADVVGTVRPLRPLGLPRGGPGRHFTGRLACPAAGVEAAPRTVSLRRVGYRLGLPRPLRAVSGRSAPRSGSPRRSSAPRCSDGVVYEVRYHWPKAPTPERCIQMSKASRPSPTPRAGPRGHVLLHTRRAPAPLHGHTRSPTAMLPAALLRSPPGRLLAPRPLLCHAPAQQPSAATAAARGLLVRGAGSPVVKRAPDGGGGWLLWHQSGARVALATSPDGLRWGAPVSPDPLLPSEDWWAFDTAAVRPSDVLLISGPAASSRRFPSSAVYWLYYTGSTDGRFSGSPIPDADVPALPGLAISQDGRNWARIEGDHHTGALLSVREEGEEPPGWEARCIAAPKVVMHADGDLRMYYHAFDEMSQRHAIGLARSRDGIRWTKIGKVLEGGRAGSFDECGVRHGHVVRDRAAGRYVMVYEGVDADGRVSIGMTVSEDGLKGWRRSSEMPVLCPCEEDEGWDGAGVGSPCLVQMDGPYDWRLYYMGVGRDGEASIGMAYSEGQALQKFEKCDAVLM